MPRLSILGRSLKVVFHVGEGAARPLDPDAVLAGLQDVAALVNSRDWTPDERLGFTALRRLVMFTGRVRVGPWTIARPGCAEHRGCFYWEVGEFMDEPDVRIRAAILFHDGWHVVQHRREGGFALGDAARVRREEDALERQIEVSERLGVRAEAVDWLRAFRADRAGILARLEQGVTGGPGAPG